LLKEVTRLSGIETMPHCAAMQPPFAAFRTPVASSIQGLPPCLCLQRTSYDLGKQCCSPARLRLTLSMTASLCEHALPKSLARPQIPATHATWTHDPVVRETY
jgi:hypothetical protein